MAAHDYRIDLLKLKDGQHDITFTIGGDFFLDFPHTEIRDAQVQARLLIRKDPRLLDLHLHLDGELTLSCDRCNGDLDWPIFSNVRLIYSFEPSFKGTDEQDISYLKPGQQYLDLRQDLYDYISLQVPLRKVPDTGSRHQCPPEIMAILAAGAEAAARHAEEEPTAEIEGDGSNDPRWAALKGLRLGDN